MLGRRFLAELPQRGPASVWPRRILPAGAIAALLSGCAWAPNPPDTPAAVLQALAGRWHNAAQFAAAPAALKRPPSVEGDWLDLQHASFTPVQAPALGPLVLYLEWRNGSATGTISRQRLWAFRADPDGTLRMDFHAFMDGRPWAGRAAEPGAFIALQASSLRSYGAACALRLLPQAGGGFEGTVDAAQCSITAASGRRMGISARVALAADGTLSYEESGRLDDGRFAFRVPPGGPYLFRRAGGA